MFHEIKAGCFIHNINLNEIDSIRCLNIDHQRFVWPYIQIGFKNKTSQTICFGDKEEMMLQYELLKGKL